MSSMSRSSIRSGMGGMYESETMRLQREVDFFTKKLEHEKRRLLIFEEQLKQVNNEIDERTNLERAVDPDPKVDKVPQSQKIISLQKNIKNE